MKAGIAEIVGRRIAGVAVARSPRSPREQVFLVFDDGMSFEFWGNDFSCCGGVDRAAGIADYVESAGGEIVTIHGPLVNRVPSPGNRRTNRKEIAIRSPWTSPPWKPSRTRRIYSMALAMRAIEKAKGR